MSLEPSDFNRIRWLVLAHLVLASAPMLGWLLPFSMAMLPLRWALIELPLGSLMTLSFWVGLGRMRLLWRIAIGMAGGFYLSFWPFLQESLESRDASGAPIYKNVDEWIMGYLQSVIQFGTLLVLFSATFMLIRRWYELALVRREFLPSHNERWQFSMLHIMVVMSVIAVVLSLLRATRQTPDQETTWGWLAINALMFVIFFVNTACAAFATLGPGQVKRNVGLVMVASILLGVTVAIAMHQDQTNWWLFLGSMTLAIIPTTIVLGSLLLARSSGFRLVRRENGDATGG
jgi:hypothetical protein